jgi:hypothetical protein
MHHRQNHLESKCPYICLQGPVQGNAWTWQLFSVSVGQPGKLLLVLAGTMKVPGPGGTHDHIFIISKTFTCCEMGCVCVGGGLRVEEWNYMLSSRLPYAHEDCRRIKNGFSNAREDYVPILDTKWSFLPPEFSGYINKGEVVPVLN